MDGVRIIGKINDRPNLRGIEHRFRASPRQRFTTSSSVDSSRLNYCSLPVVLRPARGRMETSCRIFFGLVRDSFVLLNRRLPIRFSPWQHHAHQEQEKRPMFHDTLLHSLCTLPEHTVTSSIWITADYPERSARNADAAFASETGLKKTSQLKYLHPLPAPSSRRRRRPASLSNSAPAGTLCRISTAERITT